MRLISNMPYRRANKTRRRLRNTLRIGRARYIGCRRLVATCSKRHRMRPTPVQFMLLVSLLFSAQAWAQTTATSDHNHLSAEVQGVYPTVQALYVDLHQYPELSGHE